MKLKNRVLMERAIGIVEGVSFCLDAEKSSALVAVVEMLDAIIADEKKETKT